MRLITVLLATFLVLVSSALAERTVPGVTGVGVKLGFGYATLDNTVPEFSDEESFAGGTFGAFLTYSFTPAFSVQPELLFVAKGAGGSFFRGRSWRHDYLEIPVVAKYCLSTQTKVKPHLYMGPALAFLLSAEFRSSIIGDDIDVADAMKSTDFSMVMGGALEYRRWTLDVRYDLGLINVYDPDEWNRLLGAEDPTDIYHMEQNDTVANRFFSFALCFTF